MTDTIRTATAADRDGIVAVFLSCWRESYRGLLPDAVIEAMTDERAEALWDRVLAEADAPTVVAERDGAVVGVTRWRDSDVYSLYVDPHTQGGGIGSRLLAHARSAMRDAGFAESHLWVFAANEAGRGFYASRGWTEAGTTRVQEEFGAEELRLVRSTHD